MVTANEMPHLGMGGEKKSKKKEEGRTFRFEIIFSEPTKNQYTELNWKQMIKKQEADEIMEDDEDQEIKVITQRLMQKYGTETGSAKKAVRKETVRKVAGDEEDDYDFEDPFIDDSEIIDEVVPEEVTTVHGGFYINKGSLEFKNTEIVIDKDEEKAFKEPKITAIDPEFKKKSPAVESLQTPTFKKPNIGPKSSDKKVSVLGDKSKQKVAENSQIWKMIEKQQASKSKEKQVKVKQQSPIKTYDLTSPDKKSPTPKNKKSTPAKPVTTTDGAVTISRIKTEAANGTKLNRG